MDDNYIPCFGCDTSSSGILKTNFDHYGNFYPYGFNDEYGNSIERQAREAFDTTRQSRRIICRRTPAGGRQCNLRVDRMMQVRQRTYGRAIEFVQNEEYLSEEDLNIIR